MTFDSIASPERMRDATTVPLRSAQLLAAQAWARRSLVASSAGELARVVRSAPLLAALA